MTALAIPTATETSAQAAEQRRGFFNDVVVMIRRNLVHLSREPMQLSDVTVQPVLFTLLFIYIFGAGIAVPGGGSYKDFALAGLLSLNLTTSVMGTAVGLCTDMTSGAIDRFRTLPMWRAAVLIGRTACDALTATLCITIVAITGLAIGWRPTHGILDVIAGFAVALLFSFSLSWASACVGLVSKGPESAQSVGMLILFPLAFVSNAMVPTQRMPAILRFIANWNPVSAVTSAVRQLLGNPNPSINIHAWPMQHPVAATLLWSCALLAICGPLAVSLYRRRTID
jgi:ABC-2 type transport system permease protein